MIYVIASLYNNKPRSFWHSDKKFYSAVFSLKGCNLRTYKSLPSAKRAFSKLHFKGAELAILEVMDGQSVMDGKEVFYKCD